MFLCLFVDDVLHIRKSNVELDKFEQQVEQRLEVRKEQNPRIFLGLELNYTGGDIHVHQRMKIEKAEAMVDLEKRIVKVQLQENLKLENASGKPLADLRPFQSFLGSLLHIALGTRPDICFAVHAMSRRTSCATTTDLKLDALKLEMEVDASFAMGPKKKSVYGYLTKVSNAPFCTDLSWNR
eukprot:augustus_masked-scaffold_17-processed-gene-2.7-mRNA-1 protein AED:0.24 eAED:0.27 QI:0/0/0/1/1/1/2/0/181